MARFIIRLAWAWLILVGSILITPIGPICITCGPNAPGFMGRVAATVFGLVSIGLGIAGFAPGGRLPAGRAAPQR